MQFFQNDNGDVVTLLPETATNKYQNKLLWVRCANGAVTSLWESEFKRDFHQITTYP